MGSASQGLGRDPLSGDCSGLCIYAKRLEQGRFACLWRDATARAVQLTMSELQLFLEGSALVGRVALSPAPFVVGARPKNVARTGPAML